MLKNRRLWSCLCFAMLMAIFILDSATVVFGAKEGITMCLNTVIPSLFPFCILSTILNASLAGSHLSFLRPFGRLCKIPEGTEVILLLGLLGGYPIGAQVIADTFNQGNMSKRTAYRLLGFCNNAGPSFIFGLLSTYFSSISMVFIVWVIHMLSAIFVGMVIPGDTEQPAQVKLQSPISFSYAVYKSIKTMSIICAWVVFFRVIIHLLDKWVLCFLPNILRALIAGFLEMTNGCCQLDHIPSEGLRMILCCGFLAVGGVCVMMQTQSITQELGLGMYLQGKFLQVCISVTLASIMATVMVSDMPKGVMIWVIVPAVILSCIWIRRMQKNSSIMKSNML